jgi:hypothetical protein
MKLTFKLMGKPKSRKGIRKKERQGKKKKTEKRGRKKRNNEKKEGKRARKGGKVNGPKN